MMKCQQLGANSAMVKETMDNNALLSNTHSTHNYSAQLHELFCS
jgi:hypothetical protein